MAPTTPKPDPFRNLSWNDLDAWTGSVIVERGRDYHRCGLVKDLARTPEDALVAWVLGTRKYATLVEMSGGKLNSSCTCPYDGTCKHAVAVALAYLELLKRGVEPPPVGERDERLRLLEEDETEEEDEEEDFEQKEAPADRRTARPVSDRIRSFLRSQTKDQLLALLEELAATHERVRRDLRDRSDLARGSVEKLTVRIRREIEELSAEPGWRNHWNDEGYIPDYSGVRNRLSALLDRGHADEVLALGLELLEAGANQVEMSNDEGETAGEIASCLDIVFEALPRSTLSPVEQMLWAVEAELIDDYELCRGARAFWALGHEMDEWSRLADELLQRIGNCVPKENQGCAGYTRDYLSNWLIAALEEAGRQDEVIPLCEREADITASYARLVKRLIAAGRNEEAKAWIRKGIAATRDTMPGIADELRQSLRGIWEREGAWPQVAASRSEDFFDEPGVRTYEELRRAAERAGLWPEVRAYCLRYLETGKPPCPRESKSKPDSLPAWPLAKVEPPPADPRWPRKFPMVDVLLDLAIDEGQPDLALRWYEAIGWPSGGWDPGLRDDKVAEAVAEAYPDRAVAIWKKLAEGRIALTQRSAYEAAAQYLRKIQRVLCGLGREEEWRAYLAGIKQANARKPRLMEILGRLKAGAIVEES